MNGENTEVENFSNHITDGAILRSKVRWCKEGENCSKYFLLLEEHSKTSSCIRKLLTEDGQEIANPEHTWCPKKVHEFEIKSLCSESRSINKVDVIC